MSSSVFSQSHAFDISFMPLFLPLYIAFDFYLWLNISITLFMRACWNWQTGMFQAHVAKTVWVQIPSLAPYWRIFMLHVLKRSLIFVLALFLVLAALIGVKEVQRRKAVTEIYLSDVLNPTKVEGVRLRVAGGYTYDYGRDEIDEFLSLISDRSIKVFRVGSFSPDAEGWDYLLDIEGDMDYSVIVFSSPEEYKYAGQFSLNGGIYRFELDNLFLTEFENKNMTYEDVRKGQ